MPVSDKTLFTIRLSVENQKQILKGLNSEVKKTKLTRNKCVETILLNYFNGKKSNAS